MSNTIYGFTPTHPGEVLKDEVEYRNLSQTLLARQMGLSYKILNDILNERRPLTTTTAMLFEAAMGIPADALMRMQLKYNMQMVAKDKSFIKRLDKIRKIAAMF
jgi:addiction module HigA family antidote